MKLKEAIDAVESINPTIGANINFNKPVNTEQEKNKRKNYSSSSKFEELLSKLLNKSDVKYENKEIVKNQITNLYIEGRISLLDIENATSVQTLISKEEVANRYLRNTLENIRKREKFDAHPINFSN